jgi:predicted esterase
VLGGFSQGGAMSIFSGITAPTQIGGIFGLSCYLLLHNKLKEFVGEDNPNKGTKIFMGHGSEDPLIKPQFGQMTAEILRGMGWGVEFKIYPYVLAYIIC